MSRRVAGIDISDRSVEVVSLLAKGSGVIDGAVRIELPPGMISRGDIQDFNGAVKVISAMLDRLFGSRRGKVQVGLSLPETVVYSKVFTLPSALDERQSEDALVISASERFPVESGADMAYDFIESSERDGRREFLYATAESRLIGDYVRLMEASGAEPLFIEPESAALSRALVPRGGEEATMIADIGACTTLLIDLDGAGRQTFSAALPTGGERLTAEIERQLKLSMEEAEDQKVGSGFDEDIDGGRILMIIQEPFEAIVKEIRRTLDFTASAKGLKTEKVILAGGTSLLPKAADYVSMSLEGVGVASGDPLRHVGVEEEAALPADFQGKKILYSTAIGLGMRAVDTRGHPGLNLHPAARRSDRAIGRFASIRDVFNKLSRLMPSSKKKAAKKPAAKKTSRTTASVKTAKSARAKPLARDADMAKGPKAETVVTAASEAAKPGIAAGEEAAMPVIPDEMAEERPAAEQAAAAEKETAAAEPVTETGPDAESVPDEGNGSVEHGATFENPERDFGMGVGELLGSAMPNEDEVEDKTGGYAASAAAGKGSDEGEKLSIESILSGKTPSERTPAAYAGASGSRWRIVVPIVVFLLALVVIAAGAGLFRSLKEQGTSQRFFSAVMSLFVKEDEVALPDSGSVPEPAAPASVVANFMVTAGEPEDGLSFPVVRSRVIETDVELEESFEATGTAQADDARAVGTITIVNGLPRAFSFVARTRFLSPDGVLFRMKNPADIPASGTVDVEVYADLTGPGSDIGPSEFTIPGLSEALQEDVYGRSSAAMTGGSGTVAAVSEQDIEAARTALMAKLSAEARENFKSMVGESELVLDGLITDKAGDETVPAAGTVGATFKMKLAAQFRALLVPADDIAKALEGRIAETIPAGENPDAYGLGEALYTVEAHDAVGDRAEIRVEAALSKL